MSAAELIVVVGAALVAGAVAGSYGWLSAGWGGLAAGIVSGAGTMLVIARGLWP